MFYIQQMKFKWTNYYIQSKSYTKIYKYVFHPSLVSEEVIYLEIYDKIEVHITQIIQYSTMSIIQSLTPLTSVKSIPLYKIVIFIALKN